MTTSFKTNPVSLKDLMRDCRVGKLQLPDFQRGWVWDQDRIIDLIASISEGFPIGALMTLDASGEVTFAVRPVEGANPSVPKLEAYLLDGQQRMTSLFQATSTRTPVNTKTAKGRPSKLHFYFNMRACIDDQNLRRDSIVAVPEDRILRSDFGRKVELDLSSEQNEIEALYFPIDRVFEASKWHDQLVRWVMENKQEREEHYNISDRFKEMIVENFNQYDIPVITLGKDTSREAVCLVFEKVNTGGKPLDAFELVTAMYAADNFNLRDDWKKRRGELLKYRVLAKIEPVEFLQAVSLLHTLEMRRTAEANNMEPSAVSATKQTLLRTPLSAFKKHADAVETGYQRAAKFLHGQRIFRAYDLPYQGQLVPLVAILSVLGDRWENDAVRQKVAQWFWCGVFGEQYGSATESRFAKDVSEVPVWIDGGAVPSTIERANFEEKRLRTLRSRLSAAYKGVNTLLMKCGAEDWLTGQAYDSTIFFDENVDIHHIFPRAWCEDKKIEAGIYNSIINKTPLSARTNRILGGSAPSVYLSKLENGSEDREPLDANRIDELLASHEINQELLRSDQFANFFEDRHSRLLALIEGAMGKKSTPEAVSPPDDTLFVSEEEENADEPDYDRNDVFDERGC